MKALVLIGLLTHSELKYVPKWHMNPTGTEACYAFNDAKTLVLLDNQLELCVARDTAFQAATADFQESTAQYRRALELANKQIVDEKMYSADLASKLKKSIEEREAAATRAQVGWTVAGGLALIDVCIGVGAWLAKK